jgi:hypothetical protein
MYITWQIEAYIYFGYDSGFFGEGILFKFTNPVPKILIKLS